MDNKKDKRNKRKAKGEQHHQRRQQQQHHPWDEGGGAVAKETTTTTTTATTLTRFLVCMAPVMVSLPGAGSNNSTSEQEPTILQVLNGVTTNATTSEVDQSQVPIAGATATDRCAATETSKFIEIETAALQTEHLPEEVGQPVEEEEEEKAEAKGEEQLDAQISQNFIEAEIASVDRQHNRTASDNLVSSHKGTDEPKDINVNYSVSADKEKNSPSVQGSGEPLIVPPTFDRQQSREHVFDIESHLIETYDEYQTNDDSVGINELPPIKVELTQGSSKIENDPNVRTIIEVEPAGPKIRQPVETLYLSLQPHLVAEVNDSEPKRDTEKHEPINTEDIKQTAEKLINEIEEQVVETLTKILAAQTEFDTSEKDKLEHVYTDEASIETLPPQSAPISNSTAAEKTDSWALLAEINKTLSQKVDEQLSEVTSILKATKHAHVSLNLSGVHGEHLDVEIDTPTTKSELKLVNVPASQTPSDVEEKKLFIDSLPQINTDATDAKKLADDCKREYYQSLKKYLLHNSDCDRPPVPLQTYRWEDLRRARERGGYPWTHLYKRPLGPDEEPEIVLLLRKSQELRFTSESPKSLKKVRIDEQVLVKETERYLQELTDEDNDDDNHDYGEGAEEHNQRHIATDDEENRSVHSESISCVSDSVLATGRPRKSTRFSKIRNFLRRRSGRSVDDAQSLPGTSANTSRRHSEENFTTDTATDTTPQILVNGKSPEHTHTPCYPMMKKLRGMADRQKKRMQIKRINLGKDEKIVLGEETKIMKLKASPKSDRGEIPHFIEKQDSDDILEIVQLEESPSRKRRDDGYFDDEDAALARGDVEPTASIVVPDEIIELPASKQPDQMNGQELPANKNIEHLEHIDEEATSSIVAPPPKKTPRLRREHVYEEISENERNAMNGVQPSGDIIGMASVDALKKSLAKQDNIILDDVEAANKPIVLDRMGSSEESEVADVKPTATNLFAPISSIDSTSSDEDRVKSQLSPVAEESDDGGNLNEGEMTAEAVRIVEEFEQSGDLKPSIKKEASPAPSDKKVTFSHVEDEAEPHREDIELPEEVREAAAALRKWKNFSDHEYEPIGVPATADERQTSILKESSPTPKQNVVESFEITSMEVDNNVQVAEHPDGELKEAEEMQKDLEERFFHSTTSTPRTDSRTDYEIHTSQVDSSALEELPLKPENRKKSFMATAQDRTRKMQAGLRNQAGKLKSKLRSPVKKPQSQQSPPPPPTHPSDSPKLKERKRFKAPEFAKMKMPEIKRPEFTKFNKPDMSKFKISEKFTAIKLKRSKSLKENESPQEVEEEQTAAEPAPASAGAQPQKKMFEFNFGTYPRAFRKKKKTAEEAAPLQQQQSSFGTETGLSVTIPSTETQPSTVESSSSPQGDRGPGPVRSRWADKFSDVSYNDSEGSRSRRYGSEQESFDRESSLERRMKEDLEDTGSETHELGILGGIETDNKQFAEFDEENRAIHEISNLRAGEFKRRPMVHQDSDLRSEDSKDAIGWTDKEIQKNKLLRTAELEAEASYLKYPPEDAGYAHETQSTASSGKKVVLEEIDDDEFFLRKRGISQDNIELRQYISDAIREGYDDGRPLNALERVGQSADEQQRQHQQQMEQYPDYDVPPPKPRRLHKTYRPEDMSQEFDIAHSDYGNDSISMSQDGSDYFGPPKRPMRKGRSRSKYSMDSQDVPMPDEHVIEQYFDDDEEYLRPPPALRGQTAYSKQNDVNNFDYDFADGKQHLFAAADAEADAASDVLRPQPPRRRKRQLRDSSSMDKDSYLNGFSGRSVSNNYLQPTEDVIVYRTEHEYPIPLATPEHYTDTGTPATSHKSRSTSRFEEDDRTSRGAESLALDAINLRNSDYDEEARDVQEKFIIDMMENDGYAVVRKEHIPKPTPPARRKKFSRSPGERFATTPSVSTKRTTPPPERPPPPREYRPRVEADHQEIVPSQTKPALGLDIAAVQNYADDDDDYEEPGSVLSAELRAESPRNLQSGEIINKMKYRPLPPPPRPPREKRHRHDQGDGNKFDDHDGGAERIASSSTADSYEANEGYDSDQRFVEVEVSTQTDPLPDDFVCEEFEITPDMKVIEPSRPARAALTLGELLQREEAQLAGGDDQTHLLTEDEQLARGLQRFREANKRSASGGSRTSSLADRSKSLSRPQTPSAIVIERRIPSPLPGDANQTMLEASLLVRPIDDLDLEEEALRREGLLTDSSQQSKSDAESHRSQAEDDGESKLGASDHSRPASSVELDEALERLRSYEGETRVSTDAKIESATDAEADYGDDAERYSNHYDEDEEDQPKQQQQQKVPTESEKEDDDTMLAEEQPPQPPPRRKSSTATVESQPALAELPDVSTQSSQPNAMAHIATSHPTQLADLEVERLRVHALQAGQILVSQLHGTQISSDELECKSGSLVVKNIELPAGFIDDIVERVRSTDHRGQLLSSETQTSLQASDETLPVERDAMVPPPKPPRHRDVEATQPSTGDVDRRLENLDEQTQTDPTATSTTGTTTTAIPTSPTPPPFPVYATTEYLQSLPPLAFYNLRSRAEGEDAAEGDEDGSHTCQRPHRSRRRHHHYHRCESSPSSDVDVDVDGEDEKMRLRRSRSRTRTPRSTSASSEAPQTVIQAGRQFISACSLSLVDIINQLTACVRGGDINKDDGGETRLRQIPTLVVLFIVITFGLLIFLLSGKRVHTHHWDHFNLPDTDGRLS